MKLRTSFFNWSIARKDITRFFPVWVLYTVLMLITVLPSVATGRTWSHPVRNLDSCLQAMGFFNMIYGFLVAQLLFGELFNSRLCNALHAMPATRTARFISHTCAGLAFAFVPNFVLSVLMLPALGRFWFTAPLWLLAIDAQYLFFFAIGVFCAMCTGSPPAVAMVYAIINLLSPIVYWFAVSVFSPLMPGVVMDFEAYGMFCPVYALSLESEYLLVERNFSAGGVLQLGEFEGLGESWWYLLAATLVAVAAMVFSLLMYRRRKLENAGSFIAVKWIRPVFLVIYTLCVGAFFTLFGSIFGTLGLVILLIVGMLVGFFTGKMLLERTIRVFKKKTFLQLAILTVAMLLAVGIVKIDLFGVVRYVPEVEDVAYVHIQKYGGVDLHFDDEKEIVRQIHTAAVKKQCDGSCDKGHESIYMEYHLKNGRVVTRQYRICHSTPEHDLYRSLSRKWQGY